MRLTISIPEAQVVDAPTLLRIVRMAPACDVEGDEQGAPYVDSSGAQGVDWVGAESIIHQADISGRRESVS